MTEMVPMGSFPALPGATLDDTDRADIAASFQAAIVDTLTAKCLRALKATGRNRLIVAGGVGANRALRDQLASATQALGARVYYPRPLYCTDNGAMIALAGALRISQADRDYTIQARPRWPLGEMTLR